VLSGANEQTHTKLTLINTVINYICTLVENKADSNFKKIFSVCGNTISLQF